MELGKEFQQTDIGIIPKDWEALRLGEIGESITGLTYKPTDVSEYGTLVLRASNIQNSRLAFKDNVYVNMDIPKRVVTKENDLLICVRNGSKQLIGKCALIDRKTEGSAFGAFMSVYRSEINKLMVHQFQSSVIQKQIDEVMGATINQLTNKNLREFIVPIPKNKNEREAIANTLSDTDVYIESLEKLITKKRLIKKGIMQELLSGKKRVLGKRAIFKNSDLGQIPSDWDVKTLGEIGEAFVGLVYKPSDVKENGTLVLRSSNIQNERLAFEDNVFVDTSIPERVITRKNDLLICARNGSRQLIGKCALIDEATAGSAFGAFMLVFRTKHSAFIHYAFMSESIKRQINEVLGATINQITSKDLKSFKIALPTDQEEEKLIGNTLKDFDEEIFRLTDKLKKVSLIKKGMMQELLTGRIRLV